MHESRPWRVVVVLAAAAASCQLPRQQPATPQRPTVSVNTTTTAEGTLELEAGVNVDPADAFDSPLRLKYGTGPATELFAGVSPYQRFDAPGADVDGSSDLVLGARHRLWQGGEDLPSGAVVLATKLPTASTASGLSSGETDLRAALVLNQSVGPVGLNAFYQYGALGDPAGAGTVSEHTGTLTASVALTDRWSALAELAGVVVPAQDLESWFVITGVAWAAEPWLVLDAGVTVGLSDDAPDLQVFVGFTQNFGGPARAR